MAIHKNVSLIEKPCYHEYATVLFRDTQKVWWGPCSCWYLMHIVQHLIQPEVRLSHLPSVFLRDIMHSRAISAESHVKGLMSYWSSPLPQLGSSPQPFPTWNLAVCGTGLPNPGFRQVIQGREGLLLWITRRREGVTAGAAPKASQGMKKSNAVVGQPHEKIRSKDSKLLPSTYWQTQACSFKHSPVKSGFFQILTEKWSGLIVPFGSNCFLRSWCSSQIFLLHNRRALRGPRSCAGTYLTHSLASAIRNRSSLAHACCSFTPCITRSPVPSSQLCTKSRQWAWFTAAFLHFYLRIIPFKSEYGLD